MNEWYQRQRERGRESVLSVASVPERLHVVQASYGMKFALSRRRTRPWESGEGGDLSWLSDTGRRLLN